MEEVYELPTEPRVLTDVLNLVKVPHVGCAKALSERHKRLVLYQKDVEGFSAWQLSGFDDLTSPQQLGAVFNSPFNPHRFALDPTSLCSLTATSATEAAHRQAAGHCSLR